MYKVIFFIAAIVMLMLSAIPIVSMVLLGSKTTLSYKILFMLSCGITVLIMLGVRVFRKYDFGVVRVLYYYFGLLSIGFFVSLLYWSVFLIARKPVIVWPFILARLGVFCYGIWNYNKPLTVKEIPLVSSKIATPFNFVQIADIQYGSTTKRHMEKVIKKAIALDPTFIVLVGDLIDFDGYGPDDFGIFDQVSVPVYFVTGNHEYYHDNKRILSYLSKYDTIRILEDETVTIDALQTTITGIDYIHYRSQSFESTVDTLKPDTNYFSIFLNHVPEKVEFAAQQGFDVLLYGHTHGGQMWPYNLLVKALFPYSIGVHTIGSSTVYTTLGAGLWGPRLRLGSTNEIVHIHVTPE